MKQMTIQLEPSTYTWLIERARRDGAFPDSWVEELVEKAKKQDEAEQAAKAPFAYITHPQAREWAEANPGAIGALEQAASSTLGGHSREALAVTAWVAATRLIGDAEEQQREIYFQMSVRSNGWSREEGEAFMVALARCLPLPAPSTETTEQKP